MRRELRRAADALASRSPGRYLRLPPGCPLNATPPLSVEAPSGAAVGGEPASSQPVDWRLGTLIFLSGASGLIYQVLWVRALSRHFGATTPAVATVLVAFMAGLALGSALLGRLADRSGEPLRLYRWIEVGIGVSGLFVTMLLLRGDVLLEPLARWVAGPGEAPGRAIAVMLLLALPTSLMGGTLPVLVRALSRAGAHGRTVGTLYTVNTAGAVVGALLPDLVLIPHVGLTATGLLAVSGNLLVAVAVPRVIGRVPIAADAGGASGAPGLSVPPAVLALAIASGATGLALEVLWTRVVEFWTPPRIASFSMVLATYLCAWAAGAWATRRAADRARSPLAWGGALLALGGALALVPILLATPWRTLVDPLMAPTPPMLSPSQPQLLVQSALTALWLEAPTCFALGGAFPFMARAALAGTETGRSLGVALGANTLAGAFGSLIAGFVLLPHFGLQQGLVMVALGAAVCGAGVSARGAAPARGLALAALCFAGLAFALLPKGALQRVNVGVPDDELLEVREGPTTTVAAARRLKWGQPSFDELVFPRVSMSDTGFAARRYMGMLAHLGLFFSSDTGPKTALLICYGVGNSARSLLSHPELTRLDVADLSPEVLALAPNFAAAQGANPLDDPRVRVHVDDGRHHLLVSDDRWSVITSEPPPPIAPGVSKLYSREYYALARRHLAPGGVLTQWLPVFQLDEAQTGAIVAAFTAEFPHAALFYGYRYQWVLVGSDRPLAVDLARWTALADTPAVAVDLEAIGVDGVGDLVGAFLQGDAGLRKAVANVPPVTDDLPSIEYPWAGVGPVPALPPGLVGEPYDVAALFTGAPDGALLARVRPAVERMHRLIPMLSDNALLPEDLRDMVTGPALWGLAPSGPLPRALKALIGLADDRLNPATAAAKAGPAPAQALVTAARGAFYERRWADAIQLLDRLPATVEDTTGRWVIRGGAARALGETDAARANFRHAAEVSTDARARAFATRLADSAGDPWPPESGPLSDPGATATPPASAP